MAGPAPSNESSGRRTLRLAFGVALTFVVAQLIGWPMAHIAPLLAGLLLQEASPQSVRQALRILGTALSAIVGGFLTALFLLPYPAAMALVFSVVLFRLYLYVLMSGLQIMIFAGILIGTVIMPVLVQVLPEVAFIAGFGLLMDFVVAVLAAWIAFLVVPSSKAPPAPIHGTLSYTEAASIAATLTVVVAPLLIGFLLFGWTDILTLVYAVIFAFGMGSAASGEMGWKIMTANLIYAGVGMLLVFELLVMVPNLPFMIVLVFTVCVIYGSWIFGAGPKAAAWASGFNGFLLLLGGALLSDDVVSAVKLFDRVILIFLATAYVVFAYQVVDLIKSLSPGRRARLRSQSTTSSGTYAGSFAFWLSAKCPKWVISGHKQGGSKMTACADAFSAESDTIRTIREFRFATRTFIRLISDITLRRFQLRATS